jgi:uncharacterized protein YacL (UPF0231 family)
MENDLTEFLFVNYKKDKLNSAIRQNIHNQIFSPFFFDYCFNEDVIVSSVRELEEYNAKIVQIETSCANKNRFKAALAYHYIKFVKSIFNEEGLKRQVVLGGGSIINSPSLDYSHVHIFEECFKYSDTNFIAYCGQALFIEISKQTYMNDAPKNLTLKVDSCLTENEGIVVPENSVKRAIFHKKNECDPFLIYEIDGRYEFSTNETLVLTQPEKSIYIN